MLCTNSFIALIYHPSNPNTLFHRHSGQKCVNATTSIREWTLGMWYVVYVYQHVPYILSTKHCPGWISTNRAGRVFLQTKSTVKHTHYMATNAPVTETSICGCSDNIINSRNKSYFRYTHPLLALIDTGHHTPKMMFACGVRHTPFVIPALNSFAYSKQTVAQHNREEKPKAKTINNFRRRFQIIGPSVNKMLSMNSQMLSTQNEKTRNTVI